MRLAVSVPQKLFQFAEAEWASPALQKYGQFVARHPRLLIGCSILLTALLSLGWLRMRISDDLRFMYTPPGSPSFSEYRVHMDYQRDGNLSYAYVYVAVVDPRGGNLLTEEASNIIVNANQYISDNLTVDTFINGFREKASYGQDLCPRVPICPDSNSVVDVFLQTYFDPDAGYGRENFTDADADGLRNNFSYPVSTLYGVDAFLASHFYDVHQNEEGAVDRVGLIHLLYFYPVRQEDDQQSIDAFESALTSYFARVEASHYDDVHFILFSMNRLQKEVAQNTVRTMPFLPLTVVILVAYTLWTTIIISDPVASKPMEGLLGVCTTLLAVVSAGGLVLAWGIPYNSTVAVVPFLTLALAVDDTYIMLASWRETDRRLNTEKRLGRVLGSAGCAITVAMLTDVLAFVVGSFSNTPAISNFCMFIGAAVVFDYVYQITFFTAFLAIGGKREEAGRHCIFFWRSAADAPVWRQDGTFPNAVTGAMHKDSEPPAPHGANREAAYSQGRIEQFLRRNYSSILMSTRFRITALLLYLVYVGLSLWGCMNLGVNLTPRKLLMRDSELVQYSTLVEKYAWSEGIIAFVYVQNAPNFESVEERIRFEEFVHTLENSSYALGRQSTTLWLNDYMTFLDHLQIDLDDSSDSFAENLPSFLHLSDKQRWKRYMRLSNRTVISNYSQPLSSVRIVDTPTTNFSAPRFLPHHEPNSRRTLHVDSFFFTTGFHFSGWPQLADVVGEWRRVCKAYPEYQIVIFDDNNFYADQIVSLAPNVIQDTGIAFVCIIAAGVIFVPCRQILFWVTWSLFSMNLGVIGFLGLAGCDIDPTAAISFLLSIGLAVDFTMHVACHFHRSTISLGKQRRLADVTRKVLEETLAAAGWPLLQGGLSTIFAVIVLFFVPSYVMSVFLGTVSLVVVLGILHAMIYLPMLLASVSLDTPQRKQRSVTAA